LTHRHRHGTLEVAQVITVMDDDSTMHPKYFEERRHQKTEQWAVDPCWLVIYKYMSYV
jgi:hypothetical protein